LFFPVVPGDSEEKIAGIETLPKEWFYDILLATSSGLNHRKNSI
jgi:hypothetical protein